jgi:hypothetical protein
MGAGWVVFTFSQLVGISGVAGVVRTNWGQHRAGC